jgi:putative transposase
MTAGHRYKQLRRFDHPNHLRLLTFSCRNRGPLFERGNLYEDFIQHLYQVSEREGVAVHAFVVMPEHVHLLVRPNLGVVSHFLHALKRPFARRACRRLRAAGMTNIDAFWQPGGGYDQNLWSRDAIERAVDYIHANPVRRGLSCSATEYRWSSACERDFSRVWTTVPITF